MLRFLAVALLISADYCNVFGNVINNKNVDGSSTMRRYDGDKVFHLMPQSREQVKFLESFLEAPSEQFDFWIEPTVPGRPVDLHVSADLLQSFLGLVNASQIPYVVTVDDVQRLVDDVNAENEKASSASMKLRGDADGMSTRVVNTFPTLENLYAWLDTICSTYATGEVTATCGVAGQSYEKRNIRYVKISASTEMTKKTVFIEGTIHAREWLGTATIVYIMNKMLTTYSSDPVAKRMLDKYDWLIVPVVNPDGYVYTHTTDRMWRKTRSPNANWPTCPGADPNRNWDHDFKVAGSSNSPCADNYAGSAAFSEVETKSLSEFISANKNNMLAYFAFHAYSQYWLISYGSGTRPTDYSELLRVANIGGTALMAVYKKTWTVGNIKDVIYAATGGSIDWVKAKAGVKYTYALEMRPASSALNGFIVATSEIEPSGLEVWAGLVAALDAMQQ